MSIMELMRGARIAVETHTTGREVHVAIGRNTGLGGTNMASIHLDFIITELTVRADGQTIMHDGHLMV